MKKYILGVLIFFGLGVVAYAINTQLTGFRVAKNTETKIDVHNNCKKVTNTSSIGEAFVPTKTKAEWDDVIAKNPSHLSFGECHHPDYGNTCYSYNVNGNCMSLEGTINENGLCSVNSKAIYPISGDHSNTTNVCIQQTFRGETLASIYDYRIDREYDYLIKCNGIYTSISGPSSYDIEPGSGIGVFRVATIAGSELINNSNCEICYDTNNNSGYDLCNPIQKEEYISYLLGTSGCFNSICWQVYDF